MNLGALIAAGHSPLSIVDWTWDQVGLASRAVQLYHLDLAARLITGKSSVAEAASAGGAGSVGVRPDREWLHQDPAAVSDEEKARIATAELAELARFVAGPGATIDKVGDAGTIGVKFTRG